MKPGDSLKITNVIRSHKTGVLLPQRGTFVRDIENLGWTLILVYFGPAGEEYLFPNEVEVWSETRNRVRLLLTYKSDAIDVSSYVSRRVNPSRTYLASNSKSSQIYSKEKSARYPLSKPILVLLELPRQSRGDWILRIVFFAGNIFRCFVVQHGRDPYLARKIRRTE